MMRYLLLFVCISLVSRLFAAQVLAVDPQEFDRILQLKMEDLTAEASALLEKKYPEEDWKGYRFPEVVYSSKPVETGYQVAVKESELLMEIPCYCFCETIGHESLLNCFLKDGKAGAEYDEHAVACNICYGQAMLAFLWKHAGARHKEILEGMERKFEWLLKHREHGSHTDH